MASAILCVDDNEAALHPRKLVLESAGHKVQTAVSAAVARELIANQRFDLAIVDYYLDGIRGNELAAELKAFHPGMAVILLSGADGLEDSNMWTVSCTRVKARRLCSKRSSGLRS